jgi:hypothetical protein
MDPPEEDVLHPFTPEAPIACGTTIATPLDRVVPEQQRWYPSFQTRSAVWLRGAVVLGDRDDEKAALVLAHGKEGQAGEKRLLPTSYHPLEGTQDMWRVNVGGEDQILTRDLHLYRLVEGATGPDLVRWASFGFPAPTYGWRLCGQGAGGVPTRAVVLRGERVGVFDLRSRPEENRVGRLPFVAESGVLVPGEGGDELYVTVRKREGAESSVQIHRVVLHDEVGGAFRLEVMEQTRQAIPGWAPHLVTVGGHVYVGIEGTSGGRLRDQVYRVARQGGSLELVDARPASVRAMVAAGERLVAGGTVFEVSERGGLEEAGTVPSPATVDGFPFFGDVVEDVVVLPGNGWLVSNGRGDEVAADVSCLE